ncbi:CbiX/SirB N-terminal domain-containing protein [Paenibacillus sp. FSL H8-0537]|uniref:sirohydrochlorin chelatase n=1 Tax=Paenibacillus sp. FSL H8-0537 TaxID=2921399 RepID=UPI0031010483
MKKPGILVISHGSRDAQWVRLVDEAVKRATETMQRAEVPVYSSFLEIVEGRLIQDGIDELEAQGVTELYVLPLFISSGSTHIDEIGQAFGFAPISDFEGDLGIFRVNAHVHMGMPINDDPEIAELLLENLKPLSADPSREALLLIGHGSKEPVFHERWQQGLDALAGRIRELGGFARAETAMLLPDQAAERLKGMQVERPEEAVIVVPLFLSNGYFTNEVIPERLSGLDYRYNGRPMLPDPAIERWLVRNMVDWLAGLERTEVN